MWQHTIKRPSRAEKSENVSLLCLTFFGLWWFPFCWAPLRPNMLNMPKSAPGRACYKQTRNTFQPSRLTGVRLWAVITLQTLRWELGGWSRPWNESMMMMQLLTDGSLEFIERLGELFLLVGVECVSADVVEKQRDFGAVLHRWDEQIGQLQSVTSLVLIAPLCSQHPQSVWHHHSTEGASVASKYSAQTPLYSRSSVELLDNERLHFLTWLKSSRLDLSQFSSLRSKYLLKPEFN